MTPTTLKKVKTSGLLPEKSNILIYFIKEKPLSSWGWPHINTKTHNTIFLNKVKNSDMFFADSYAMKYAKKHNLNMFVDMVCHKETIRIFFSSEDLI